MTRTGFRESTVGVVAVLLALAMIGSGLSKLVGESHQVSAFAMWGLPAWFLTFVGVWEIAGAVLLAIGATRPVGSVVLSTILVGALWTHATHAEWTHLGPPAVLLAAFLWIFWQTRSRTVQLLGVAPAERVPPRPPQHDAEYRAHSAVIWFNRVVLAAGTFVMMAIAIRTLRDPVAATMPLGIVLGSPSAATVARVGFGGFPLGFACVLFACLVSTRRLPAGLGLLATVISAAMAARIQGLVVDGATAYNVALLRPEFAMLALSLIGIWLQHRGREPRRVGGGGSVASTLDLGPSTLGLQAEGLRSKAQGLRPKA